MIQEAGLMGLALEYLMFVLKFATVLILIVAAVLIVIKAAAAVRGSGTREKGQLEFIDLRARFKERSEQINDCLKDLTPPEVTADNLDKAEPKRKKPKAKELRLKERRERLEYLDKLKARAEAGERCPRHLFVINFKGDVKGSGVGSLTRKINAILDAADEQDEVVVRLESPGGVVNTYGLCSAQLKRLRDRGIYLTVCVDNVAASGGYLMACVANHITAAPFAYIGSIGVVAQLPNFNRLLKKNYVDYEQITAGKYKRTVSVLGENTEEGREKLKEELAAIHERFKGVVREFRPGIDLERTATGEHWLAQDALELGLVDEIATSDDYIARRAGLTSGCVIQIKQVHGRKKGKLSQLLNFFSRKDSLAAELMDELGAKTGIDSIR